MPPREELGPDPVHVREATDAGWTRAARRHAQTVGTVQQLRYGVVRGVAPDDDAPPWERRRSQLLLEARAAQVSSPRSIISHQAAAVVWTMPTVDLRDTPCLTVPAGTALRRVAHVHLHRATLPDDDVVLREGLRLTAPARTALDIAREHGVDAGVAAADYALHEKVATVDDLAAAFEVCSRWPGRRAARLTLLLADPASESVLESLSRLRLGRAGLPAPRTQPLICDEHGRPIARCDFYWDEFGVVGEADGNLKYRDDSEAIIDERTRQQDLETCGLIVVRWGWNSLRSFDTVARRLRTAFGRGARRGSVDRRWGVIRTDG